jgi:hypothetical protein
VPATGSRLAAALVTLLLVVTTAACSDGSITVERDPTTTAPDAPTTTAGNARTGTGVSAAVAQAIADASSESGLVRWGGPQVTVGVAGAPTTRDLEVLDAAAAELASASGLELSRVDGPGDITVTFAPRDEWTLEPEPAETGHVLGVTRARWGGDGLLRGADVAIDAAIGQAARNQAIVHELVHALGLGHIACTTSVVHGGSSGAPGWTLTALDREVVAAWYDGDLVSGSDADTVQGELEVVDTGAPCEPQVFVAAETAEGTIWCEPALGPSPCVHVDGLGPPPTAPLTPEVWMLDDVVYDHDPTRYEVFTFEGRRLLCELGDSSRRPCQYTDGPGPLTGADVWTDGTTVYRSP